MYKIITFCPKDDAAKLINAMSAKGAGKIGKYTHCSFVSEGLGSWLPLPGANPTQGEVGELSQEPICKLEMVCEEVHLDDAIKALQEAHSFESPEVEVIKLEKFLY